MRTLHAAVAAALAALPAAALAQPLTTAFTYQAELSSNNAPAAGLYDIQFVLFDAPTGGLQVGPTLCSDNLTLEQGRLAVQLDFGAAFTGQQRYLEVRVRTDTGLSCGSASGFTTLSPRHPLTAAPHAAFALLAASADIAASAASASNAANLNGQPASFYTNAANLTSGSLSNARLPVPFALTGNVQGGTTQLLNVQNTNLAYGVGINSTATGVGLKATSTATTGQTFGGQFTSNSDGGTGLLVTANNGEYGLHAIASGTFSSAVVGEATSTTGNTLGVMGTSQSPDGIGMLGYGGRLGVLAQASAPGGHGLESSAPADGFAGYFNGRGYFSGTVGIGVTDTDSRPLYSRGAEIYPARFESTHSLATAVEFSNTASGAVWEFGVTGTGNPFGLSSGYMYLFKQGNAAPAISITSTNLILTKTIQASATGSSYAIYGSNSSSNSRGELGSDSIFAGGAVGVVGYSPATGVFGMDTSGISQGVWGKTQGGWGVLGEGLTNGVGVRGRVGLATSSTSYGVLGSCSDSDDYGVYSLGRTGASGTKSFRIDHPSDPANRYLLHYASESPDVTNFYSGKVTLDDRGEAAVELPAYFAAINKDPRYTLTPIGAPMPMLHIALEVDDDALTRGNAANPGDELPRCSFRIAGGAPGGKVSWRVEATRNDRWMQAHCAPVEQDKIGSEKGTYQHPDLYAQPPTSGLQATPSPRTATAAAK